MIGFLLGHLGLISALLGAGGGVLSMIFPEAALAILRAVGALPKPVFIAGCGLLAFLFIRAEGESRHWHKQSDRYEKLYNQEHSGRLADRKSYVDAQAKAAAQNKAHVQTIEQQYQRNSDDEKHSYLDDLARLRRMRGQNGPAPSAANGAGSPAPHDTTAGADANGLPVPRPDDVQAASEIELRLMHLQNWVERQLGVDPNKP